VTIGPGFGIFLLIMFFLVFYGLIETGVRRGIDCSKLSKRIEKIEESINKINNNNLK